MSGDSSDEKYVKKTSVSFTQVSLDMVEKLRESTRESMTFSDAINSLLSSILVSEIDLGSSAPLNPILPKDYVKKTSISFSQESLDIIGKNQEVHGNNLNFSEALNHLIIQYSTNLIDHLGGATPSKKVQVDGTGNHELANTTVDQSTEEGSDLVSKLDLIYNNVLDIKRLSFDLSEREKPHNYEAVKPRNYDGEFEALRDSINDITSSIKRISQEVNRLSLRRDPDQDRVEVLDKSASNIGVIWLLLGLVFINLALTLVSLFGGP